MTRARYAFLLAALLPSAALADYPFILPSSTSLSGSRNVVTFDAAGSDHVFAFDHRPIGLDSIKAFKPDGSPAELSNSVQGRFRSVFDLALDQDGTWKVESAQTMVGGTFKQNGEVRRVGGRRFGGPQEERGQGAARDGGERPRGEGGPPRGEGAGGGDGGAGPRRQPPVALQDIPADATDVHLTETVRTTATFVTNGGTTTTVFKPTGKGLEFDPVTHPDGLAQGEAARFRFLIDGKPAAGIKVTAVPGGERYRDNSAALALTTDAAGVVTIKWPTAGMWWLGAEAEDRHPSERRAEARKMDYAVTLEVMTP